MFRAKSNPFSLLVAILTSLLLAACSADAPESTSIPLLQETLVVETAEPEPTMAPEGDRAELEETVPTAENEFTLSGTSWEMDNALRGTTVTVAFGEGSLSGSSGCNKYSATYTTTPIEDSTQSISISSINSTNQTCTLEVMGQEQGYLESLATADRYTIAGDMLTLETGRGVLTFRRAPQ